MVLNDRQNEIIEMLKTDTRVSVKKLAAKLFVSEMTIRRDLKAMEQEGFLKRYNGGAIYIGDDEYYPIDARITLHANEKAAIAQSVREFLSDSLYVYIDSSSTVGYIIPILAEYRDIKIITNSVANLLLASKYHIKCFLAGGEYDRHDKCLTGGETERFLSSFCVDIGFFSAQGITDDGEIYDSNLSQVYARKSIINNCDYTVFLLDKSKVGKKYLYRVCNSSDVSKVIVI